MSIFSREISGVLFLLGSFVILSLNLFFEKSFIESLVLFFGWLLIIAFLYRPKWGLFLILFFRLIIDKLGSEVILSVGDNLRFSLSAAFGVLVVFLLSIFLFKNLRLIKIGRIGFLWILLILASLVSFFWSINLQASFYEFVRVLGIFMIFCSFYLVAKEEDYNESIIYAIIFSSIIPFTVAFYQFLTKNGLGGTSGIESRLYGTFSHPNQFAFFSVIVIACLLYVILIKKGLYKLSFYHGLLMINLFLLIQTFSRGAWLAFLVFVFVLSMFRSVKIIIGLILISFLLFLVSPSIQERVEDIYNPPADSSIKWRILQWERAYKAYQKSSYIGYGLGTEIIVHENEYGFYVGDPYTHNDFVRNFLEVGIPGGIAYILLLIVTGVVLFKNYRKATGDDLKTFNLFVFSIFISMVILSFSDNVLRGTINQWIIWGLIGTSITLSSNKKELV